jgi:hypothetical protein
VKSPAVTGLFVVFGGIGDTNMIHIEHGATRANALRGRSRPALAARLKSIRAQINAVWAAPYGHGRNGPHRRQRDEYILQALAADIHARMIEARTA